MKNLVKLFTVIALLAIGFSASAQTEKDPTIIHKGATRVFTILDHTGSIYKWTVVKDGSAATLAPTLSGDATNALTVTWNETGKYKVTVIESSSVKCTDSDVNTKVYWVSVEASDFAVSVVWAKPTDVCAIATSETDLNNEIIFTVSSSGGMFSADKKNWTFEYEYQISEDGSTWTTLSSTGAAGSLSVEKELTSNLIFTKPIALDDASNKDYELRVKIINAKDAYGSTAPDSKFAIATYHRLPTTSDITID